MPREAGIRLTKAERLRTDGEYRGVVHRGERLRTTHFTVYRDFRGPGRKIGISVGKRIGTAVERNRLKRVLREFFRLHKDAFPAGSRTAIVARIPPPEVKLSAVCAELLPAITGRWGRKDGGTQCGRQTSPSAS